MQHNDDNLIFASQARGKQEVTLSISESEPSEKITIYAYFENPIQEASIEVSLKTGEPGYIIISTGEADNWGRIKTYKYSKGILYEEIDDFNRDNQLYKKEPYTGNVNTNVQKIKEDLDILAKNSEGKKLLDFFEDQKKVFIGMISKEKAKKRIEAGQSTDYADKNNISYQGIEIDLPVENSYSAKPIPSYIILGHEMGHVMSYYKNQQDTRKWEDEGIVIDEIYASHIENKIRKAAGIPLRDFYERDKFGGTRLVDIEHFSLYINKEESNYPNLKPKKLDKNIAYNYDIIQKDQ